MKKILISILLVGVFSMTANAETIVTMKTNYGAIEIELYEKEAPITVANFLKYVESGFYTYTIFHRVIETFMIQGGGFDTAFLQKETDAEIKNEADNGLKNDRGTISMARRMEINSASSQFFINTQDNPSLNHRNNSPQGYGYAVFGKVISGMDVVDVIAKVDTGSKEHHNDVPLNNVVVESITVIYKK